MEAFPFLDNPLTVVAHADHELTEERNIPLQRIADERILVREEGSGTRIAISDEFAKHGIQVNPYMELGSTEAIKQGTMAGLGVSILSRNNIQAELASGQLVALDVEGFPLMRRWYVGYLKGKKLSRVADTFLQFLLAYCQDDLNREAPGR